MNGLVLKVFQMLIALALLSGCMDSEADKRQSPLLQHWLDSLDKASKNGGGPEAMDYLRSRIDTLSNVSVRDRFDYYAGMRLLSDRDETTAHLGDRYSDSMLLVLESKKDIPGFAQDYAHTLMLKGDNLKRAGRYQAAYENYFSARKIMEKFDDFCHLGAYSARLAMTLYDEHNYVPAIAKWQEALKYLDQCADTTGIVWGFAERQGYLNNIALSYKHLAEVDSASAYFNEALKFIVDTRQRFPDDSTFVTQAYLNVLGNLGVMEMERKNFELAEGIFEKCLSYDVLNPSCADVLGARLMLADLMIRTNRLPIAEAHLDTLSSELGSDIRNVLGKKWMQLRADLLLQKGDFEGSSALLKRILDRNEREVVKASRLNKPDITAVIDNTEQQYELADANERFARQRVLFFVLVMLFILSVSIVFLLWQNRRYAKNRLVLIERMNRISSEKNEELSKVVETLRLAQLENQKILHVVSHDLKSPLSSFNSVLDLIKSKQLEEEEQDHMIELVQEANDSALRLIAKLPLPANERFELILERTSWSNLLMTVTELVAHVAQDKELHIDLDVQDCLVEIDRDQMSRVLQNLMTNAIKFSHRGGTIYVRTELTSENVLVTIKDEGVGIPRSFQDRVFLPYSYASKVGTDGEESTGMGLYICKQIVQAHKGELWFSSEEGRGTTFFLEFPVN